MPQPHMLTAAQPRATHARTRAVATHVCSYLCYTSEFVPGVTDNWCLLRNSTSVDTTNYSFCSIGNAFPGANNYPKLLR